MQKRQLEEQLLLQKKHEDELKQTIDPSFDLVIPLNLQTKPAPKLPKEKSKKKAKKGKKRRRRKSSDSSSSSSSSPSSSSSSSEDEKPKKKKTTKKSKAKENEHVVKAALPAKSKWEKEDSDSEIANRAASPDLSQHPILEARKVVSTMRKYRWNEDFHANRSRKPPSPHVPERHTILIPESSKVKEPTATKPPPDVPPPVIRTRVREREREEPEDVESRFDKQAEAANAKKKPLPVLPKTKFAFIGRMPFAKKRTVPSEERPTKKEQDVKTPDPTPPPPPVISKKVVPVVQPLPPVLTNKTKVEVAKEILTKSQTALKKRQPARDVRPIDPVLMEMDMEIEKQEPSPPHIQMPPSPPKIRPPLPPEVTTNLGKKTMNVPLPPDFQEALSIIYPEQPPKPKTPPPPPAPPRAPSPPRLATPPPPPPPPGFDDDLDFSDVPPAPSPPCTFEMFSSERACIIPSASGMDDFDEMALLGIDKEDMAAQRF